MKYFVAIGDQEIEVDVDGDRVTIDGRTYAAESRGIPGTPLRQLLIDGQPMTAAINAGGRGEWALALGGEHFEAEVVDERTRHIRRLVNDRGGKPAAGVIRAPMPGLVVRVPAVVGQEVAAGASLVVLEAMKMENELRASAAATVRTVLVEAGQAVEKGQVLIEFE